MRSHPLIRLLTLTLLGAIASRRILAVVRAHRTRRSDASDGLDERVQTWEGEGGRPPAASPLDATPQASLAETP